MTAGSGLADARAAARSATGRQFGELAFLVAGWSAHGSSTRPVAAPDRFVVRAFQGLQAAHLLVEFDLAQVAGVAGGDGLGFGGRGADVSATEVLDFGVEHFVAAHLFDEQGLGLRPSATSPCRSCLR